MPAALDLKGMRFARLYAIRPLPERVNGKIMWEFKCDCGRVFIARAALVRSGNTKSCGCLKLERITALKYRHGLCRTRLYVVWCRIKQRCLNQKCGDYPYYGGRGIKICERWVNSFESFSEDMGAPPDDSWTVDRFPDNDGNYEPGNCRWATRKQQSANSRVPKLVTVNGQTRNCSEWAREFGLSSTAILMRIRRGMSPEEAVLMGPPKPR